MPNQMVKSGVEISVGYPLIGMVIGGIWEVNAIKTVESISQLEELFSWLGGERLCLLASITSLRQVVIY